MKYRRLGSTDVFVSTICLGTMTWGEQNTEDQGHKQMDYALEHGVTFWDTAELYAVPPRSHTYGRTEEIIGSWFQTRKQREKIILATKVAGYSPNLYWIRKGQNRLDKPNITAALEASLRRLQTDYVDLYQLHWPDRPSLRFGSRYYKRTRSEDNTPIEETLAVLHELVQQGKIRFIGVSNETPWGVMQFLHHAHNNNLTRIVSIQNPYNLLNRTFENGLSEIALYENCGLLAYSPLGGGVLTGKYLKGARPAGSRFSLTPMSRYSTINAEHAISAYVSLARQHNLDPAQMAIAFTRQQDFVTSSIIGATSMEQLKIDIGSAEITLSQEVQKKIGYIAEQYPDPCP